MLNPGFHALMDQIIHQAHSLEFLVKRRAKTAELRDRLQHKAMMWIGTSAPRVAGRRRKDSGITSSYPGPWAKAAYDRQYAVLQETNDANGNKTRRRGKKSRNAPHAEEGEGSGTQPGPVDKKRKGEDKGGKNAKNTKL